MLSYIQLQKLLQMRRKGVLEDEQRDSGTDYLGDEDDIPLGPQSNVSLLDQHQHLKEKAEGRTGKVGCSVGEERSLRQRSVIDCSVILCSS